MSDWTLLIDFGTSFTRAAIADIDGRAEQTGLPTQLAIEPDGRLAMPSGIWADPGGRLIAGSPAREQARLSPECADRAPGRSLGRPEQLLLGEDAVDPVAAVAAVLRRVSDEAVRRQGSRPREIRLTCSPRWDDTRRAALVAAAGLADLGSPPLLGEPVLVEQPVATALRLARQDRFPVGTSIAVLNLGGGSAETAVLESTPDGIRVRALGGIEGVGGEQFDDLIYRKVVAHKLGGLNSPLGRRLWEPPDAAWRQAAEDLFREVRRAKEELTDQRYVTLHTDDLIDVPLELSRVEVEAVLRPPILRSARELVTTIELAGLRVRSLDRILLTGGSSRIPLVSRAIFDVTGRQPEIVDDPALFLGAALWTSAVQVGPRPPLTVAGGQTQEEADADAAAAAAALAATGSMDLSALTPPRRVRPAPAGPGGTPASGHRSAEPAGESFWRRRWPLIAVLAVLLVVVGLVLVGPASGKDDPASAPTSPAAPTAPASSSDLGSSSDPESTSDPGSASDPASSIEPAAPAAEAPYGDLQDIAAAWPGLVPLTPGAKGAAGQTCRGSGVDADRADGRIRCSYANGIRLVIMRYPGAAARSRQADEVADRPRVKDGRWAAARGGGTRFSGRLLTAGLKSRSKATPWRWWTYDAEPTYALYADWRKHSTKQLAGWWTLRAPFRTS